MFWPTFDSVYCVQCYVFSLIKQSGCLFFFVFLFCCRRLSVLLVCDMRISDVCEQNRTKMPTMGVCDSVNDPPHPLDGRKNLARFLRRNCVWTNFLWFAIVSISKYAHAIWSSWAFYSRSSLIWQWFLSDGCCTPFSIRATSCNMFISMLAMWILNSERSHRCSSAFDCFLPVILCVIHFERNKLESWWILWMVELVFVWRRNHVDLNEQICLFRVILTEQKFDIINRMSFQWAIWINRVYSKVLINNNKKLNESVYVI